MSASHSFVLLDRHRDVAVARLVDEIDETLGMLLADTVIDHGLGFHVRSPQEGDDRIEHGDVDRLALSGSFPVEERRRDRLGGDDAGELVRDDGPHQARPRLVRSCLNGRQPGKGLHKGIIDRL